MNCSQSEMHTIENLLRAIEEKGDDGIDGLGLSPEELDRYFGCLLVSGMVTAAGNGTEIRQLRPTTAGHALLGLIRKLDEILKGNKSLGHTELYVLQQMDIDRIKTELIN